MLVTTRKESKRVEVVPVALAGESDEVLHAQEVVVELALAELGRVEVERAHLTQQRHTDTEIPAHQQTKQNKTNT